MIRCEKCGTALQDKDTVYWKCTECNKAFKLSLLKLQGIGRQKNKIENANKSLLKCPSCSSALDNGNEQILCKCSSCENVIKGNLKRFTSEYTENTISTATQSSNPSSGLVKCPECGKDISKKARKCVHCGKILIDNSSAKLICSDCGKEIPTNATECPNCGCPVEGDTEAISTKPHSTHKTKKNIKKILIPVFTIIITVAIALPIYYINILRPKKIEAQNKATYEEAIVLLERGKYEDGNELLQTITGYKDVDTILEQIKWESRVYECITAIRQYLKNPDSLQVYEVVFYDGYKSDLDETMKTAMEDLVNLSGGEPICVMHRGGQNGFGGNTTGYSLFLCSDGVYKYMGSCDSLDEDKIDDDDKEELAICGLINLYKDNLEQVGDVDLARIKTIIKNDSYSTIKIIE